MVKQLNLKSTNYEAAEAANALKQLIKDTVSECLENKELFKQALIETLKDEEVKRATLSFIQDEEVVSATCLMEEQIGFRLPRPCGYQVLIKMFIREEVVKRITDDDGKRLMGSDGKPLVYLAGEEELREREKYNCFVGLVLALGPEAYKGSRFKGFYCRPGDWVIMEKNAGLTHGFKGMPVVLVDDDRIKGIYEDPNDITPLLEANRF